MKRLYWWWYRKTHDLPHPDDVWHKLQNKKPNYELRYNKIAFYYTLGFTLEYIANRFVVPRERVRQCIAKAYRNTK